ncbi:MAG: hypothetical protein QOF59_94 [Actinomycetota bacterium]|nr:hypothetical protein [Actinomycetota bacterium]
MTDFRGQQLTTKIASFADTLHDDFDVRTFSQRLADTTVEIAQVADATVMLADDDGTLRWVASTSRERCVHEMFARQEQFARQGPSVCSYRTAAFVGGPFDDESERRWPAFVRRARAAGFAGAWSLPMRLREDVIGALSVLSAGPVIAAEQLTGAQALADVATIGLVQQRLIERVRDVNRMLQPVLDLRIVVEQAKGIVAEHAKVDMDDAFALVGGFARATGRELSELCREITQGVVHPQALILLSRDRQA